MPRRGTSTRFLGVSWSQIQGLSFFFFGVPWEGRSHARLVPRPLPAQVQVPGTSLSDLVGGRVQLTALLNLVLDLAGNGTDGRLGTQ